MRERVAAYKSRLGCSACGETDPVVLDLHHVDPSTKTRTISSMYGMQWPKLEQEISKCIVLCANEHRRLHHA